MTVPHASPDTPTQIAPPTLEARERVVAQLSSHFAQDRLTLQELERRVHTAYATQSGTELEQLVTDLEPHDSPRGGALAHPLQRRIRTILSSAERGGPIIIPRRLEIQTVLGTTQLDLSSASFAPGVTEIAVHAVLGTVEITLPSHVQVALEGSPVIGSFALKSGAYAHPTAECLVRITGHAVLSSVETWVTPPLMRPDERR